MLNKRERRAAHKWYKIMKEKRIRYYNNLKNKNRNINPNIYI